jgi:hypothetical protein
MISVVSCRSGVAYFRFLLNNGFVNSGEGRETICKQGVQIMAKYLYAYHGGSVPQSKEEGERIMKAWMGWFGQLGAAVVDGGNPVGKSTTVKNGSVVGDGGANPVSGYSIIEASSAEDAVAKAKSCPIITAGGSVEIAEILAM